MLAVVLLGLWSGWRRGRRRRQGLKVADKAMEVAETLVGKALFLRGFYLANDLNL